MKVRYRDKFLLFFIDTSSADAKWISMEYVLYILLENNGIVFQSFKYMQTLRVAALMPQNWIAKLINL